MPTRWLLITAFALAADYGVWSWATGTGSDTPAVVSGLALAPLAVALAWMLVLQGLALLGRTVRATRARLRPPPSRAVISETAPRPGGAQEATAKRIAA